MPRLANFDRPVLGPTLSVLAHSKTRMLRIVCCIFTDRSQSSQILWKIPPRRNVHVWWLCHEMYEFLPVVLVPRLRGKSFHHPGTSYALEYATRDYHEWWGDILLSCSQHLVSISNRGAFLSILILSMHTEEYTQTYPMKRSFLFVIQNEMSVKRGWDGARNGWSNRQAGRAFILIS